MSHIDPRAVIDEKACLGDGVTVGPFAVVGPRVIIGDGTKIGPAAFIEKDTTIGKDCFIAHGAVVGSDPQDLKYNGERSLLTVGDRTTIREFATINRAAGAGEATVIGDDVLIMAYVHIAHNCIIGDSVVIVNAVNLAGHVEVGEYAIIGGVTPVHQFVRIGKYSFVGGASRISKDIPPYFKVAGIPTRPIEVNTVGLQRHGFSEETLSRLRQCYRLLYLSDLNTTQALSRIRVEMKVCDEVETLVTFIESSSRGILK